MNKSFLKGFVVGGAIFSALYIGGSIFSLKWSVLTPAEKWKMFYIAQMINDEYYEDVEREQLIEGVYAGLTSDLDKYSGYMTKDMLDDFIEAANEENYGGIGAQYVTLKSTGYFKVTNVRKNTPAERAGLQEGDIIYEVDGEDVAENDDVTMRGEAGTPVTLSIERGDDHLKLTIVREIVEFPIVEYEDKGNGIGYIKLLDFYNTGVDKFAEALEKLEGCSHFIIDLRGNPGGEVSALQGIASLLFPNGQIMSIVDKDGTEESVDIENGTDVKRDIYVLVDESSASCSEAFCGLVQDNGYGKIVGEQTFGKGVVQTVFTLSDGTAVKLTTAKYVTPAGRELDKVGIVPDVECDSEDALDVAISLILEDS